MLLQTEKTALQEQITKTMKMFQDQLAHTVKMAAMLQVGGGRIPRGLHVCMCGLHVCASTTVHACTSVHVPVCACLHVPVHACLCLCLCMHATACGACHCVHV